MAHFAQIDTNNIVINVVVVPNSQEYRGQEFLADDLGLGGNWVQTSYNGNFRKQYAGIGYSYNPELDIFIAPQPFPSWVLDENHDWQSLKPKPQGDFWIWDEELQEWINVEANA